ncbi:MAG: cytochrome c maturation protein CcmE [Bacillota bacterium]
MNKKLKMIIAFGAVIIVLVLLFIQGFQAPGGLGMYLTIEEALAQNQQNGNNKFLQIEGEVVNSSVKYDPKQPLLQFQITDGKNNIGVSYSDVMPDNFTSGYPVIVEGRFLENTQFTAERLMVKCPSKYEEEDQKG